MVTANTSVVVVSCGIGGSSNWGCCYSSSNININIGCAVITVNIITSVSETFINFTAYVIILIYIFISVGSIGGW